MITVKMFIRNRIKSFGYACAGIIQVIQTETHAKVHLLLALGAVGLSIYFEINSTDWLFVVIAIGIVFIAEMLNTSIEKIVDMISPEYDERARFVKDVSAGSVLIAAIISLIIACLVFIKYI